MLNRGQDFLKDVRSEFSRVQWPARETTIKSTWMVLGFAVVVAVFLGTADLGLSEIIKWFIAS